MEDIIYYEIQKDKPKILSVFLVSVSGILILFMLYGLIQQLVFKIQFGNHSVDDVSLCFISGGTIVFLALFTWLYFKASLEVKITKDAIFYRYYPILFRFKKVVITDILAAYIRQYQAIKEYGGWGLRFSINAGSAVSMSGDTGLQIIKRDGKKLLIGTKKAHELEVAILKIGLGNSI